MLNIGWEIYISVSISLINIIGVRGVLGLWSVGMIRKKELRNTLI